MVVNHLDHLTGVEFGIPLLAHRQLSQMATKVKKIIESTVVIERKCVRKEFCMNALGITYIAKQIKHGLNIVRQCSDDTQNHLDTQDDPSKNMRLDPPHEENNNVPVEFVANHQDTYNIF